MRRLLWMLVAGGVIGSFVLASEAQACHFKMGCHKPACEPCVAPEPCPAPQCEPCPPPDCAPKKCCGGGLFGKHTLFCHKPKCAPQPCAEPVMWAPAASPQWVAPSTQWVAPTMQAPSKQSW
jgi:hypothetical protein